MKTVKSNVRSSLCQRKEREKHMWGRAPSPVQPSAARRMIARRQCRSQQPLSPVRGQPKTFQNGQIPPAKPDSVGHAEICKHPLTSRQRGLALNYHLRSNSGSNGPIAKECHRFLVAGPFKFVVSRCYPVDTPPIRKVLDGPIESISRLGISCPVQVFNFGP